MKILALAIYFILMGAYIEFLTISVWFHFPDWSAYLISGVLLFPLGGLVKVIWDYSL